LTDIDDQKQTAELLERLVLARTIALRQEIEERRRAEEKVQSAAAELQRSNNELEAFAYVASHDLQEPLRKIQAFGDRLARKDRAQISEQGAFYLERIQDAATRMRQLIEDLLVYARVTTRAQPFVPVDLNVVLAGVLTDLDEHIAQKGAQVEAQSLPIIDADPSQMRQLFQNLLANGLKFTPAGKPPRLRISTEEAPPGRVHLVFQDHGIGFDTRYLERIFQVFQRLHGRGEYEGTGVGLAICKKIVDRHGGMITARSQPGEGATFVVDLPTQQPRQEEAGT
jgi:light-regulated signal transduction histidine kinase (bacteriophytochrome)